MLHPIAQMPGREIIERKHETIRPIRHPNVLLSIQQVNFQTLLSRNIYYHTYSRDALYSRKLICIVMDMDYDYLYQNL